MMAMPPSHPSYHSPSPFAFSLPVNAVASGSILASPTPALTPTRKRQADSPPLSSPPFSPTYTGKKRRPNLSNGFSGLSLSPKAPVFGGQRSDCPGLTYDDLGETKHNVDENDDLGQSSGGWLGSSGRSSQQQAYDSVDRDLRVEELPDRSTSTTWTRNLTTSSSTSSDSAADFDAETMFRPRAHTKRRYARVAQQADEIQQPDDVAGPSGSSSRDLHIEDLSMGTRMAGRKRRESGNGERPRTKKRRSNRDGDDLDMSGESEVDIEEIRPTSRRRRTQWHEPEKDRKPFSQLSLRTLAALWNSELMVMQV